MKKNPLLRYVYGLMGAFLLWAIPIYAVVHTGLDTIGAVESRFDFSKQDAEPEFSRTDIVFNQSQDRDARSATALNLFGVRGIVDVGALPFEELTIFPEDVSPDPNTKTQGDSGWRIVPALEGHVYVIWTTEGHFAKLIIEDLIFVPEVYPWLDEPFADFIARVVIRWAYQDDGSRSFIDLDTAVRPDSWGTIKEERKKK